MAILIGVSFVFFAALVAIALPGLNKVTSTSSTVELPSGCVKPANGFLIVASQLGFNDSVDHGVPQSTWPVINVRQGQNVTILVCNADPSQPHGFQISNYYDGRLVSIASGHILMVTFVADKTGSFRVYCSIFCSIHWAMQSGQLKVA